MASGEAQNTSIERVFTIGLPVTLGQGAEAQAYGIVKQVDIKKGVVIVTGLNGKSDASASWPIYQVFAQP